MAYKLNEIPGFAEMKITAQGNNEKEVAKAIMEIAKKKTAKKKEKEEIKDSKLTKFLTGFLAILLSVLFSVVMIALVIKFLQWLF